MDCEGSASMHFMEKMYSYGQKYKSTMLQKLSKCEVKAWLCQNLIILLPLRFYVKSNFGESKRPKYVIFDHFRGLNFDFW